MYYVCIQVLSTSKDATVQFQGETEDNGMNPFFKFIVLVSLGNPKSEFYILSIRECASTLCLGMTTPYP